MMMYCNLWDTCIGIYGITGMDKWYIFGCHYGRVQAREREEQGGSGDGQECEAGPKRLHEPVWRCELQGRWESLAASAWRETCNCAWGLARTPKRKLRGAKNRCLRQGVVCACDEKEGGRLSEEVAVRKKAGAALLTYTCPKTLLYLCVRVSLIGIKPCSKIHWACIKEIKISVHT